MTEDKTVAGYKIVGGFVKDKELPLDLQQTRFDQLTFAGRLKRFFEIINSLFLTFSSSYLEKCKKAVLIIKMIVNDIMILHITQKQERKHLFLDVLVLKHHVMLL
uniref:CTP synthase (glutamine hydrolyzing) n=1 Tax=Strongyloides venezuelensis TaxID=75913 RepID=A0A0K0FGN4_STRVS